MMCFASYVTRISSRLTTTSLVFAPKTLCLFKATTLQVTGLLFTALRVPNGLIRCCSLAWTAIRIPYPGAATKVTVIAFGHEFCVIFMEGSAETNCM
jgi:hypothetical protein